MVESGRVLLVCAALVCASCSSRTNTPIDVAAASSLTDVMQALERAYELSHPEVDVRLSFAGSQVLRTQIERGAPFDVFASADPEHIRALEANRLVEEPERFAASDLVVIVPEKNPASIERLEDLPKAKRLVLGTEAVPVGRYARLMLTRASSEFGSSFSDEVLARVVSEESNARLVRAKVELGEADAAVVYRSDTLGVEGVRVVEIPTSVNVRASYEIALTSGAGRSKEASRFVAFVRSEEGERVLRTHGFKGAGRWGWR